MPSNKEECLSVFMLIPGFSKDPSVLSCEGEIIEALDISDLRSFTFYFPQVEAALKKYMSFGGDCQQRREFLDAGHEASRQKYLSAPALNRWLEDAKAAKTKNAQRIRNCRKDSIVNKLINIGYSPEDLESNIDQNGWKWSNLIDQPRPLTERIWENIRPQLEETIRLRREKKIELEKKLRQRRFGYATKELLYSRGSAPEDYYIVPSELLELPLAKQLFESDQVWTEIPEAQQSYIKQYAIERSNARLLKLEEEGASAIVRARREAGVPAINTIASNSSEPDRELTRNEETKTQDILQHPTTFFTIWEYGNQCLYTFSEMLEELAKHCFSELHYFRSNEPFQWALGTASYNGLRYADALYLDLAIPGSKTMDDMEALGNTFVCLRCHPTCREMKSWRNLVNHFYIEYKDYAEREVEKQRHVNCKIVNVHDHDQNDPAPLAAYIGTDATLRTVNSVTSSPASPDSSQFYEEILFEAARYDLEKSICIWPCECVGHNGRKHLRLTCRECIALGIFDYRSSNFACQGKLDKHRRAKHRVGQVLA
ncbi:hypothetical protein DFH11DRAFT_1875223 [Phellopilus nigrolimitatus]|nr:hypothetical protein DFH11DRAFT_1875223 [Phellopilus nigrolimitatus]